MRHGESSAGNSLSGRNQGISGREGPASANRLVKAAFLQCRVQGRQHWGDTSSIWDIGSGEMHHGSLIGSSGGQAWGRGCSQLWNHHVSQMWGTLTQEKRRLQKPPFLPGQLISKLSKDWSTSPAGGWPFFQVSHSLPPPHPRTEILLYPQAI